jgi:hypothetical protein
MKGPAATNSTTTPPRAPSNAGTIPLACSGFVEEDSVPSAVGWAFELFTGCGVGAGVGNSVGTNNMEGASVGTGVGASDGTDTSTSVCADTGSPGHPRSNTTT